jgi:hypothetical protein
MKIAASLCALSLAFLSNRAFAQAPFPNAGPAAPFGSVARTMAPSVETYGAGPAEEPEQFDMYSPTPLVADPHYMFGTGDRNGRLTRPRGPVGSASVANGRATATISPTGRATSIPGGSTTPGVRPQ